MSDRPQSSAGQGTPDEVLRLAVVQLDYTPNTESVNGKRWLPDEPLIKWASQKAGDRNSVRSGPVDEDTDARHRTEIVLRTARAQRHENLDRKLKQILEFCVAHRVDIVVLPEAFLPTPLVPVLVEGFRNQLAIFAGIGSLRAGDVKALADSGFATSPADSGCNAAVYIDQDTLTLVTKRDRAAGEVMAQGSGTARVTFRKGGTNHAVGLAICRDYVNAPRTFDEEVPAPHLVLVTALSKPTEDFLRTPRNFAVAFANHAAKGGSAVLMPALQGFFVNANGSEPLPTGESVVVIDYEGFGRVPTQTREPRNRLVHRTGIFYDDFSAGDEAGSQSQLARELRNMTIEHLNQGRYDELLEISEDRLRAMGGGASRLLRDAVQELRRNADTLSTASDLELFTSHIILTDVKSDHELRYGVLGSLLTEWWKLLDPKRESVADGISHYYELAQNLRKEIQPKVRIANRDSPASDRNRNIRSTGKGKRADDGFVPFYSARLGRYGSDTAVRSLQHQLGVLRTFSATEDPSARLIYRASTTLQTSGHLAPFFDVIGVTEADDPETIEDLREGVGQQLATAFRSTWSLSPGPESAAIGQQSVAQLRLRDEAFPAINEDWGTLIDYLRTLAGPVTVQMTCRQREPQPRSSRPPAGTDRGNGEVRGFFFPFERDAAAFMERAWNENEREPNLTLLVHVGSPEPLPDSVLKAIGHWLFHAMPFDIMKGPEAAASLAAGEPAVGPTLTPAEILRIFHPPYGHMEGRGMDMMQTTSLPIPHHLSSGEGLVLGEARIEGAREDRWIDVRADTASRLRHTYVVGPTGSGKTNLLKFMARQDITERRGLAVIDPHGDLVDYLVKHTSGRDEEVLLLDFGDPDYLPVLNPLDLDVETPLERNLAIENFLGLLVRQSHHTFYGPRFESTVRLVLESTTNRRYPVQPPSVLDVGTILRSMETRQWLTSLFDDVPALKERWESFNKQAGTNFAEVLDWVLAKFSEMEQDGTLRQVLAGGESSVSLDRFVASGGVLLVKIPEWEMSASAAALLGGFIEDQVRRAVFKRWRAGNDAKQPYFMYVDEFQNFSLGGFEKIVAEARKFGLGLILAHQNLDQLDAFSRYTGSSSARLRNAVLGNVANRVVFGVSSRDAAELAKDIDVGADLLRNPGPHRAVAQVLFDLRQYAFTLRVPKAESNGGYPDQYAKVRDRMIASGFWKRREELRERDASRAREIRYAVNRHRDKGRKDGYLGLPTPGGHPAPAEPAGDAPAGPAARGRRPDHAEEWKRFLDRAAAEPPRAEPPRAAGGPSGAGTDGPPGAKADGTTGASTGDVAGGATGNTPGAGADEPPGRGSDESSGPAGKGRPAPVITLDAQLLVDIGLGDLPAHHQKLMLRYIYESLETRVGTSLARRMSDEELSEFEEFIDNGDEDGALAWLTSHYPDYRETLQAELKGLLDELRAQAPDLLRVSGPSPARTTDDVRE
ncbi:DUF5663 domain-containing protein [Streptomyces sp. NPDC046988]|uniref:DUF5663 domain-containing protein n=1 Tax=Streptomyces sp. NPDC046988 TaxID=3154922 RepID=UPI0033F58F6F